MNCPSKPPCYLCGSTQLSREPAKLNINSVCLAFDLFLCFTCLDFLVRNAEKDLYVRTGQQKLPGPPLTSTMTFQPPNFRNLSVLDFNTPTKFLLKEENTEKKKRKSSKNTSIETKTKKRRMPGADRLNNSN